MSGENLCDPGGDREPGCRREHQGRGHQDLPALDLTGPDRGIAQLVQFGNGLADNRRRGEVELAAPDPDPAEVATDGRAHVAGTHGGLVVTVGGVGGCGGVRDGRGRGGSCHDTTLSGCVNHGGYPEPVSGLLATTGRLSSAPRRTVPLTRGDRLPQPAAVTDDLGGGHV